VIIRPYKEGDLNFILSTWLKSYYDALTQYSKRAQARLAPPHEVFFSEHQKKIKERLKASSVFILTTAEDLDQIIGYIVYEGDCLHFCYVKAPFRKMGVARRLKEKLLSVKQYSHHTTYSRYVAKDFIYNPYKF